MGVVNSVLASTGWVGWSKYGDSERTYFMDYPLEERKARRELTAQRWEQMVKKRRKMMMII